MMRDVIPIMSKMLYDTAREDHKSSENLKEEKKLARWFVDVVKTWVS